MFLYQNLTALHFGPKITCRTPSQLEVSLFVRGTWRIPLSGALEQVEDPVEQGFMSGDVFADADPDRLGPVLYASDFGDFKPKAEVLLKGTCHPPGGKPTTVCHVGFAVGGWSKSLAVIGPRAWKPGLLFGASMSQPAEFTRMPLTWENAFGGEGHAPNPVGKGVALGALPTVEDPRALIKSLGDRPTPATFLPISPNWPQRAKKRGKKYGASYQRTRAPWYSEDFDWSYFNAAPDDQQLDHYLRGDEELTFTNLHPDASLLKTRLPGLRVRCFLKHTDQRFVEVAMELDTLYVDMDARKLHLTWRGLSPVEHREFEDIACGLVVQEGLADAPKSVAHYREVLEAYEADPVGLNEKFPPGFLELGEQVAAEEAAELAGKPVPVDERVDPFGIRAAFPAGVLALHAAGSDDPLGVKDTFPEGFLALSERLKVGEVPVPPELEGHPLVPALSEQELLSFNLMPPEQRVPVLEKLQEAKERLQTPAAADPQTLFSVLGTSLALPPAPPRMPAIPAELQVEDPRPKLQALSQALDAKKQRYLDKGIDSPLLGLFDRSQRMISGAIAMAGGLLDAPAAPPNGPDLGPAKQGLEDSKQALVDHGDGRYEEQLGKLDEALAGLAQLSAAFPHTAPEAVGDERDFFEQDLRGRDFSGQDLSGKSFAKANLGGAKLSGANLRGAIFRGANLCKANLAGADLSQARFQAAAVLQTNLSGARLDGATILGSGVGGSDLRGASLVGADLSGSSFEGALLSEADLSGVRASKCVFRKADVTAANFTGATLIEADFSWATGVRANFTQADLSKAVLARAEFAEGSFNEAVLIEANLEQCSLRSACLDRADLDSALAERMDLSQATLKGAKLTFAVANKSILEGADLTGADLSLASLHLVRGDGCNLSDTRLGMTKFSKSRLRGAVFGGCQGEMAQFDKCDLREANLRGADLTTFNLGECKLEDADFSGATLVKASLRGVQATRARFTRADLTNAALSEGADFTGAHFQAIEAPKSIWLTSTFDGADFSWAQLPGSFFDSVKAKGARFFAAELREASFRKSKLDAPHFVSANLKGVDFSLATLLDGQFQHANCYCLILNGAKLVKCDFTKAFVEATRRDKDTVRA